MKNYEAMGAKEKRVFWYALGGIPLGYKAMTNTQVLEYILENDLLIKYEELTMGYTTSVTSNTLVCTRDLPPTCVQEFYDAPCPTQGQVLVKKGNKTMYRDEYDCPSTGLPTDQKQRDYLLNELSAIEFKARDKGERTFGLIDDPKPMTALDLKTRILEGKFIISKEFEERKTYHPLEFFRWRDPAVKEDKEGYKSFVDAMEKESKQTERKIAIVDPKEGLELLTAFETKYIN